MTALLLAGCSSLPFGLTAEAPPPTPVQSPAPPPPAVAPAPVAAPSEPPPPLPRPRPQIPQAAAIAPEPALVRPAPGPPPALIGLNESAVREVLGEPTRVSEAGPSKIWHYAPASPCPLNIAYFLDLTRNGFFVLAYDAGPNAPPARADVCLREIANDHARR